MRESCVDRNEVEFEEEIQIGSNFFTVGFLYSYREEFDGSYGADADGNRSSCATFIEDEEISEIALQVYGKRWERWVGVESLRPANQIRVKEAIWKWVEKHGRSL